jgi:hypothetical protein
MSFEDRRGAAYHEAGHIVVASALGLRVGAAVIGVDGDDAKGEADIDCDRSLPLVDRIAVCAAGREAQHVFGAPTHRLAGAMDEAKIIKLTEHPPGRGFSFCQLMHIKKASAAMRYWCDHVPRRALGERH